MGPKSKNLSMIEDGMNTLKKCHSTNPGVWLNFWRLELSLSLSVSYEAKPNLSFFLTLKGDHLTLIAAAEIFRKSIIVVSSIPNEHYLLEIHPTIDNKGPSTGKIYLSHLTEFHYGSVQEKYISDQSCLNFKVFTIDNMNPISPLIS